MLFKVLCRLARRRTSRRHSQYREFGKKQFEGWLCIFLMVWFSPVLLVLTIAVWILNGRPIFFTQERYTKDRGVFRIVKFRTMLSNRAGDNTGRIERWNPIEEEVTPFGRWLRRLKLDELPQLYANIFFYGDLNLISPRPWDVGDCVSREKANPGYFPGRFEMHGGLLGLSAMLFGRPESQRCVRHTLYWDRFYCKNSCLFLDCLIVWLTVLKPFFRLFGTKLHSVN